MLPSVVHHLPISPKAKDSPLHHQWGCFIHRAYTQHTYTNSSCSNHTRTPTQALPIPHLPCTNEVPASEDECGVLLFSAQTHLLRINTRASESLEAAFRRMWSAGSRTNCSKDTQSLANRHPNPHCLLAKPNSTWCIINSALHPLKDESWLPQDCPPPYWLRSIINQLSN